MNRQYQDSHVNERKNGWRGDLPLRVEQCYICNHTHSINFMDDQIQGCCRRCARIRKQDTKSKTALKRGN